MSAAWSTVAAAAATGLLAFLAKAWADRGKPQLDAADMALKVADELAERVARLENIEAWRAVVHTMDQEHIFQLRDHIYTRKPPPPPERPVYPPRPT